MKTELIVFDLDFTLWDCGGTWCDCLTPPFQIRAGRITDRHDRWVRLYDDVLTILDRCEDQQVAMALASRTEQPAWAIELISLLQIRDRFAFEEIYPSSKIRHFAAIQKASQLSYDQMLFFDDEMRNIREVSSLGVRSIHVPDGMNLDLFCSALNEP